MHTSPTVQHEVFKLAMRIMNLSAEIDREHKKTLEILEALRPRERTEIRLVAMEHSETVTA